MANAVVLVIDDDLKVKESLVLAFPEYEFLGAVSGDEGLKLLQRPNETDLVLLSFTPTEYRAKESAFQDKR